MYKDKWRNYFFPAKPIEIPEKWVLLRSLGKDILSEKAQLKLEWIIFHNTIAGKKTSKTAEHFGITRKTIYKLKDPTKAILEELKEFNKK